MYPMGKTFREKGQKLDSEKLNIDGLGTKERCLETNFCAELVMTLFFIIMLLVPESA